MAIAFLTRDYNGVFPYITPAGCAYYRCLLPMSVAGQRARMGMPAWDPDRGFGVKETETTGIFGFSTVVLKLIMDRWAPKQIELAKQLGQVIIVDLDDYHEALTPANKAYDATHPEKNKKANREYYEQVIAAADILTVSTPFLLEVYSQRHPNVHMIRNGVNPDQFTSKKPTNRKPVFGWAGATSYRNNDLEQLREWLPDFLEEHDVYFHHAGHQEEAPSFAEVTGIPARRVTTSPIVPIADYARGLQFDVGIVPLNIIPFNKAKSNIKGLEYAASGIPYIATDIEEYRLLHETGVGRLASTPEVWRIHAEALLDYSTRKKEAAIANAIVRRQWTVQARANEWAEVLTGAVESIQQQRHSQTPQVSRSPLPEDSQRSPQ